jgi:hypothetical protein
VDTTRLSAEEAGKEILHRLEEQGFFAG